MFDQIFDYTVLSARLVSATREGESRRPCASKVSIHVNSWLGTALGYIIRTAGTKRQQKAGRGRSELHARGHRSRNGNHQRAHAVAIPRQFRKCGGTLKALRDDGAKSSPKPSHRQVFAKAADLPSLA